MQDSSLEKAFLMTEICLVYKEDACVMEIFMKLLSKLLNFPHKSLEL